MSEHYAAGGAVPEPGHHPDSRSARSFLEARSLKRQLLAEQRTAWESGHGLSPEDLFPRWPSDPKQDPDFASFLFEDYQQRRRQGEKPSADDYSQRFPEHQQSLAHLISRHDALVSISGVSDSPALRLGLPEVGDEVFGFRLRGELGRGAFARVFLAEQANLAGRPVVLKVSGIDGDEPYTLAQLQHTHVVPIYSVHEDGRAGLRALCMPYFGGASLSSVLRLLWEQPEPPTQGEQLVRALQATQAPAPETLRSQAEGEALAGPLPAAGQTPLALLSRLSYVQTTAWVVARLAEGLQHAHQRGVLHRDIKPSNILLGADGQPMLLDFNLAQSQNAGQAKAEATLGGTVAYMAPEHLRALANPSPASVRHVDQRSDLYSLGMVLFEMLTGQSPFDQSASYSVQPVMIEAMALERSQSVPSVRRHQPTIPWGLESIVRQCLAPEPAQRYQQAEDLAEDLRRFLEDQPLRHAPELSRTEQIRKWMRRHPRLTSSASVATVAVLLLVGAGAALAGVQGHLASTRRQLEARQARERLQAYEAGTEKALCLVNTVADLQDHLRQGVKVCDETLALYGVLDRDDWQEGPAWQRLDDGDRQRLAEATRELLLLLAWARVRIGGSQPADLRDALKLLGRADAVQGLKPSRAVWADRARYLQQLGDKEAAEAARQKADRLEPASARDHYLLATTYARRGDPASLSRAVTELTNALHRNPQHYWSWVQRGICYQELGETTLAVGDFGTCIGLWPAFSWGYFNKGYALDQGGQKVEAIDAYTAALERDPAFLLAYVNRGLARLELKQYRPALADFDQALARGRDDAFLYTGRGVALEGLSRHAEADAAFALAFTKAASAPEADRTRIRWVYGFAVSKRLPEKAAEVFDEVLQDEPLHPQALYGRAMLAVEQDRPEQAIKDFSQALEVNPGFVDARRYRAVLLARLGRFTPACQDINWCLEREPRDGATLYAGACILARAAEQALDPAAADKAVDLLEKAFARGYGRDKAAEDPDLAGIRQHPVFRQLLAEAH